MCIFVLILQGISGIHKFTPKSAPSMLISNVYKPCVESNTSKS